LEKTSDVKCNNSFIGEFIIIDQQILGMNYNENRLKLLSKVGNGKISCAYCGCDDTRLLEINHKNGGGNIERNKYAEKRSGSGFRRDIVAGRRSIDDLEITCAPCNARHKLEIKYGKLPFDIRWLAIRN
jgi:hypothetical protein